jgi:hypothetical protein
MTDAAHSEPDEQSQGSADAQPGFKLRLTNPHRLINQTMLSYQAKTDPGYAPYREPERVDVRVSRKRLRLALGVLDRFFKLLEKRGLSIRINQEFNNRGTYAYSGHYDKCQVSLFEVERQVPHVPTAKEKAEQEKPFARRIPKWDSVPTGVLKLQPGGVVDLTNQHAFDEFLARAAEEVLNKIAHERHDREELEKIARAEAERRHQEEQEKKRVESFYKSADALDHYRRLMAYIEEVRRFGRVPSDQLRDGQSLEQWLGWANAQARAIHPLGY